MLRFPRSLSLAILLLVAYLQVVKTSQKEIQDMDKTRAAFEKILHLNSEAPQEHKKNTNLRKAALPRYLLYVYKNVEKRLAEDPETPAGRGAGGPEDEPDVMGAETMFKIRTFSPEPETSKVQNGFLNFRLGDLDRKEMPTHVELVLTRRTRSSPGYPLRVAVHEIDKDGKVSEEPLEWKMLRASKLKRRGFDVFRVAASVKAWIRRQAHAQEGSDIAFQIRVTTRSGYDLGAPALRDVYQLAPGSRGPALLLYFGLDRPELLHRRKSKGKDRKQRASREAEDEPEVTSGEEVTSAEEVELVTSSTGANDSSLYNSNTIERELHDNSAPTRHRRGAQARGGCKLRQWYVNFADLRWNDWIVHPSGYMANYCGGECPTPLIARHLNASNHAFLRNLIRQAIPTKHHTVPRACCTPTKLSPISVLYREKSGAYVVQKMKGMRADECGCL